jgi:hypothetical protein
LEKSIKQKFVDVSTIPVKIKKRHQEWLELFKAIPPGKAWVVTEEEAGVKAVSIKSIVNRFVDNGELPKTYKAMQRTAKNGKVTVYIANTAKTEETP